MNAAVAGIEKEPVSDISAQVIAKIGIRGISQARAAEEIGVHKSAFNQWLHGHYPGDNAKINQAAAGWLKEPVPVLIAAPLPVTEKPAGYVATPTGNAVNSRLKWAHDNKTLIVIYGDAGVGKTIACKHYVSQQSAPWTSGGACHVTITSTTNSPRAMLRRLALDFGFHKDDITREQAILHDHLIERLRGTHSLLILDEAQHLHPKELEIVRGIYDAAGIGVALVGNQTSYTRFNRGSQEQYSQLVSRVDLKLKLTGVRDGDVEALAAAWGVTDKRTIARLADVARVSDLRRVDMVLRTARKIASTAGTGIALEHVERAASQHS